MMLLWRWVVMEIAPWVKNFGASDKSYELAAWLDGLGLKLIVEKVQKVDWRIVDRRIELYLEPVEGDLLNLS
jgi:hypothetical protein